MTEVNVILFKVTQKVLEKLAFIFSFPFDEGDPECMEPDIKAVVTFTGLFSGKLILSISEPVLTELSANMLGVEEDETAREQHHDALKELINVVCGNLLPEICGDKMVFDFALPEILLEDEVSQPDYFAKLALDEGVCKAYLFTDQPIKSDL